MAGTITTQDVPFAAGKSRIAGAFNIPSKDGAVSVVYMIQVSYDGGTVWLDLVGGTLSGDHAPKLRPGEPSVILSIAVSHDGRACRLRAVLTPSAVLPMTIGFS